MRGIHDAAPARAEEATGASAPRAAGAPGSQATAAPALGADDPEGAARAASRGRAKSPASAARGIGVDHGGCAARAASRGRAKSQAGFTLIEIMAVVLIIGLLVGIVGYNVFSQVDSARVSSTRTQIKQLEGALEFYRLDNARYPSSEQGLDALVRKPTGEPQPRNYRPEGYVHGGRVPDDAWGNPFQYQSPGTHNPYSFDLWSLGADGQAGGEGNDADIGNWTEDVQASR